MSHIGAALEIPQLDLPSPPLSFSRCLKITHARTYPITSTVHHPLPTLGTTESSLPLAFTLTQNPHSHTPRIAVTKRKERKQFKSMHVKLFEKMHLATVFCSRAWVVFVLSPVRCPGQPPFIHSSSFRLCAHASHCSVAHSAAEHSAPLLL